MLFSRAALPGSVHDKKAEWIWGVLAELEAACLVTLADKGYQGSALLPLARRTARQPGVRGVIAVAAVAPGPAGCPLSRPGIRRGCRVHVVPKDVDGASMSYPRSRIAQRSGITSRGNTAGTQGYQRAHPRPVPPTHDQHRQAASHWDSTDVASTPCGPALMVPTGQAVVQRTIPGSFIAPATDDNRRRDSSDG